MRDFGLTTAWRWAAALLWGGGREAHAEAIGPLTIGELYVTAFEAMFRASDEGAKLRHEREAVTLLQYALAHKECQTWLADKISNFFDILTRDYRYAEGVLLLEQTQPYHYTRLYEPLREQRGPDAHMSSYGLTGSGISGDRILYFIERGLGKRNPQDTAQLERKKLVWPMLQRNPSLRLVVMINRPDLWEEMGVGVREVPTATA